MITVTMAESFRHLESESLDMWGENYISYLGCAPKYLVWFPIPFEVRSANLTKQWQATGVKLLVEECFRDTKSETKGFTYNPLVSHGLLDDGTSLFPRYLIVGCRNKQVNVLILL